MKAYTSQNADNRIIEALKRKGFEVHLLAPFDALAAPTDTHADMLLLKVGDVIFKHTNYMLEGDYSNICDPISAKYPYDVPLNIAIVGKHAFLNEKHASKTVLKYLNENGYRIHHVSQGYTHCSTCIVNDNALISADIGIVRTAQNLGIDVLQISKGCISLPPYEYGFIGGCSGSTDDAIYFCGSLSYHPDGEQIRDFIESHRKEVIELVDTPLSDVGGIVFL